MKAHASGMREIQLSQLAAERASDPRVRSYAQQLVSEHQQMAQDLQPLLTGAGLDKTMMDSSMPMGGTTSSSDAMRVGSTDASSANRSSTASTDAGANAGSYSTPGRPAAGPGTTDTGASSGGPSGTGRSSDATRPGAMATAGTPDSMAGTANRDRAPGAMNHDANPGQMDNGDKGSISGRWSRMLNERKQKKLMEKTGVDFDKAYINLMVDEHESAVDLFQDGADDNSTEVQMFAAKYLPKLRQHLAEAEQLDKSLN